MVFFLSLALLIIPFSQGVYGLPFTQFLKTKLGLPPTAVAGYFAIANIPWNLKVLAGLLTDSFPLFGTRRRHYLLISIGVAIGASALIAVAPLTYSALLSAYVLFMTALMFANVVAYSLLVEKGQEIGTIGDFFGDILENITAPVSGCVLFLTINPSVQANGLLMGIGAE